MDNIVDIDITEEEQDLSGEGQLPVNFLSIGEIENDDLKVYIRQDVYKALEKYAREDVQHERGTIILGDFYEELGKMHVVISDYIEAKYTDASASTLTFTHETWDYIHKEQDEKYPDKRIVGWQHTHPSYGIFLSNYDLFIQENFFNLPFQVAYVIDPIQNTRGFFQWKNDKIEKLKGFYIFDDIGKTIKIEQPRNTETNASQTKEKGEWLPKVLIILALLLAFGSLLASILLGKTINSQKQTIEAQNNRQQQLEQTIQKQSNTIQSIQKQIADDASKDENARNSGLLEKLEAQQATIDDQQKQIEELRSELDEIKEQSEKDNEYIFYTIQQGDSLGSICKELGIDYWRYRSIILEMNHLEDEDVIIAGQTLIFLPYMSKKP